VKKFVFTLDLTTIFLGYIEEKTTRFCLLHFKITVFFFSGEMSKCQTQYIMFSRYSDSVRVRRSGDGIPVGARFSAPVHIGPGTYPASYTIGTGSFPGVKRPGRSLDHPPPSSVEVKDRVQLYLYSPSRPSWPVIGRTLPFTWTCIFTTAQYAVSVSTFSTFQF
jgi:hypothetical protein